MIDLYIGIVVWAALIFFVLIGRAILYYLVSTGREDIAMEWSQTQNKIVEFVFGTAEANALSQRIVRTQPPPPSPSSGGGGGGGGVHV